jgi:hypothetical protein
VSFLIGGAFISILFPALFIGYLAIMGVYVTAGIVSASKQSKKFMVVANMVKSFFILHFSYGLGYLTGIKDFFIMQKSIKKEEHLSR